MKTAVKKWQDVLAPYQKRADGLIEWSIAMFLSEPGTLQEACRYALTTGGKRFRPALVLMMAEALPGKYNVDGVAIAVEFFHTASLIADDLPCMDNDSLRRNKPTLHCAYTESTALLASYALIAAGYEALAWNAALLPEKDQAKVMQQALLSAARNTGIQGATGGQFLDLNPPKIVTQEFLDRTIAMKTVSLFEISFVLGWVYGGGDLLLLNRIKKAAYHFGMAFQIADDLDDYEQDQASAHAINEALFRGKEKALLRVKEELSVFMGEAKGLGLESSALVSLGEALLGDLHGAFSPMQKQGQIRR